MIPGLGSDAAVWRRTIEALSGRVDCRVGDTLSDGSLARMARRILADAPSHFALAGVSMGGMVAMELMQIAPERVTRLALVDTNARPDTLGRKAYRGVANAVVGSTRDFRRLAARSVGSMVHAATPEDVRDELVNMSMRVGPTTYVRQNRAVSARGDLRPVLAGITIPTVVVVGENDTLTPPGLSQEIQSLIPGSRLEVIPACGHLPPIEKPAAMANILSSLLKLS